MYVIEETLMSVSMQDGEDSWQFEYLASATCLELVFWSLF